MSSSSTSSSRIQDLISQLASQPEREAVASEIEVLRSIYGEDALRVWSEPDKNNDNGTIRYEALLNLPSPHETISVRILVSLPPSYPLNTPPQLQLLSKYIGPFGADSSLFGSILRTYITSTGVEWISDVVCVFDGLQRVLEVCAAWYEEKLRKEKGEDDARQTRRQQEMLTDAGHDHTDISNNPSPPPQARATPAGTQIFEAEPIIDRKSVFIGRACRISHPSEVPLVLSHLLSDRRISRAAHPIINAWRCQVDNVLHQDNDDDGETAAGGRLAHLLHILEVNNVLIIVTRYFGGIHLGPDRFKHINQAARNALETGGFLDAVEKKHTGKGKK